MGDKGQKTNCNSELLTPPRNRRSGGAIESDENDITEEYDFTAISLSELLHFILEIAPVTSRYRRNFLSTFTSFSTSEEVLSFLSDYLKAPELDEEEQKKRTLAVILFVKRWIEERFDTLKEEKILNSLQTLIAIITTLQPTVSATLERILSHQLETEPQDDLKVQQQFDLPNLAWDTFDVISLAEAICFEEFLLFEKLTVDELLNWNSQKNRDQCPNIRAICNFSNHFANWVSTEIVKRAKLSERVFLLKKFVNMADLMVEMNNFSSVMSILGGLNSSPISRLKMTWKEAGKDTLEQYQRISQLMSWKSSYATYRDYLKGVVPPCLPFLGIYLTDLTFICDGNVDPEDPELINFSKWDMVASILRMVNHFQQFPFPLPKQRLNCIEGFEKYQGFDEDQLYEYSSIVEPKGGTEETKELFIEKYQELSDRLLKANQEIEELRKIQKSPETCERKTT